MPRSYKRSEEARKYGYSAKSMKCSVIDVKENGMSVKKSAFLHKVNKTTLINYLKGYRCAPVGRLTLLTNDEEIIVHAHTKLGEWGFGGDRNAVQWVVFCRVLIVSIYFNMENQALIGSMSLRKGGEMN